MSNGSSYLNLLDRSFKKLPSIRVSSNGLPIKGINDLEVVDKTVFFNVIGRSYILEFSLQEKKSQDYSKLIWKLKIHI